ncbi:hypothetical protein IFR04_001813 [Cadophora malorum]|uniref:Heterokaryon incompatibility domain-containing protein n=1 Tax=Cadophora malorum TaxID=108018 RepID=A0A8H7WI05_9HELO|nr:hypothetical protein IFR04_001813 [Cadophora malorum]
MMYKSNHSAPPKNPDSTLPILIKTTQDYSTMVDQLTERPLTELEKKFSLICLSDANKERLLRDASTFLTNAVENSSKILARMKALNPKIADEFVSKDIAISGAPLRLMFTKGAEIIENAAKEVESYSIISYCWHGHDFESNQWWPKYEDPNNKVPRPWPIDYAFVEDLLKPRLPNQDVPPNEGVPSPDVPTNEGIWIDQLCINQDDEEEKKLLVGAMDVIYRSARQLFIILEDVFISSDEEEVINRCWDMKSGNSPWDWNLPEHDMALLITAFARIMDARWFYRAWCSHEFRVTNYFMVDFNKQPRFRVKGSSGNVVRISAFLLVWIFLLLSGRAGNNISDQHFDLFQRFITPSTIQSIYRAPGSQLSRTQSPSTLFAGHMSFVQQVGETTPFKCRDMQDKCQIALNLSGVPLVWKGQILIKDFTDPCQVEKGEDELFWISTVIALSKGEIPVLGLVGLPLSLSEDGISILSWAHRPHNTRTEAKMPPHVGNLHIHSITPSYIELDLLFVESAPIQPSGRALDLAHGILQEHGLYHRNTPFVDAASKARFEEFLKTRDHEVWHKAVRIILACFIEGGVEWLKPAARLFTTEIINKGEVYQDIKDGKKVEYGIGVDFGSVADGEDFAAAATKLLSIFHIDSSTSKWETEYLQPTISLLGIITDRRFEKFCECVMHVPLNDHGDRALIGLVLPGQRMAVPAVLSGVEQTMTSRLWVLEEIIEKGKIIGWRSAMNRQFMIGCPELVPDGKFVVSRERQKVFGQKPM